MLFYRSDKVEFNFSLTRNFFLTPLSERFVNSTYIKNETGFSATEIRIQQNLSKVEFKCGFMFQPFDSSTI